MHVAMNSGEGNIPLVVAGKLVHEFIKENPDGFEGVAIDDVIVELSKKISVNYENSCKDNVVSRKIDISLDILPAVMKTWVSAKRVFNVETKSVNGSDFRLVVPYTCANTDWSDVEIVTTAREGVRGAWFFSNAERGSVVVKGQEEADKQVMGMVFLRMMGINAPDTKIVACSSLEGKQLSLMGQSVGLNGRSPSHYIVMERVMGPSYTNLSSKDVSIVEMNLERLGELAVYDLVLGNFDRFQLDSTSFNSGNIMFQDNVMQAIDTDCIFDEDREGFTKLALKKLIEDRSDLPSKIARKLANNLGDGVSLENFWTDKINKGIKIALGNLLKIVGNLENFREQYLNSCAKRGVININFPLHLEMFLQHILTCTKNFVR